MPYDHTVVMSMPAGRLCDIPFLAQSHSLALQMILEHYAKGDKAMLISDIKAKTGKATSAAPPKAVNEE